MKIILALPSRNEQDAIIRITKSADLALQSLGPNYQGVLLNIDHSEDKTQSLFLSVNTYAEKAAKVVSAGKGTAMIEAMRFLKEIGGDVLIFSDTDLQFIHSEWIRRFVKMIEKGYGAVFPWRIPHWNAQDLTNQLCYPLLRGIFKAPIHEPIGGEFAISRDTCDFFLHEEVPDFALTYGIDFYITSKIATNIPWIEIPLESDKGNQLRSYKKSQENLIVFGTKFYEVFLSTINCCSSFLRTSNSLTMINSVYKLSNQWKLETIPIEDEEMIKLQEKTLQGIRLKQYALETRLSHKTKASIARISSLSKEEFWGVSWDLWSQIVLECLISFHNSKFSQKELEAIEQIFLARTLNHYLKHRGKNTWFNTIEDQVEIMNIKCEKIYQSITHTDHSIN